METRENWNSANGFIHYGNSGEFASNRREDQALSIHLLQICLVYVNTLMIQHVGAIATVHRSTATIDFAASAMSGALDSLRV